MNNIKNQKEEKIAIWQEVAKQVAHEIKTPLSSMKLNIQYLQRIAEREGKVSLSQMDNTGKSIIQQIDALAEIASIFGDFAQLPQPNLQAIALNNLVRNAYITFSEHKEIHLDLDLPQEEVRILGDKNYIIRVLNNLIKNAIQATPKNKPGIIRIILEKDLLKNLAVIKIMDNGVGIPEEEKSIIFQPHFTTKKTGMGLGLAIVQNIITSLNGRISFHSSLNRGTVFVIQLPLYE